MQQIIINIDTMVGRANEKSCSVGYVYVDIILG